MRRTKIICTMGPATANEETLTALCLAGMNVARLNFSHGDHESHRQMINLIKKVREKLELPIAIMLDTKGPEYRIGDFENGKIELKDGDEFIFTAQDILGDSTRVSVSYKNLAHELNIGDTILVNNGLVAFRVIEVGDDYVKCIVENGGEISNRKSMAFPNKVLNQVFLSEQDKSDILFGIENDVDYIAASFVSTRENVLDIKNFLRENGGRDIDVVAKIENRAGVDNIDEICLACEGIMVARGDLGVEIPYEQLPAIQKRIITACRMKGRRVITATEMLESMIHNLRPTRAEISDVANAVYDGTSAVMLSGETAIGKNPPLVVKTMDAICRETENTIRYNKQFHDAEFEIQNNIDAVSHAACAMALSIGAKAITVCSISGATARMVSRFRPDIDILGLTTNLKVWRKLSLSWGVIPMLAEEFNSVEVMYYAAAKATARMLSLQKGDNVIVVGGTISGKVGSANNIRLETL